MRIQGNKNLGRPILTKDEFDDLYHQVHMANLRTESVTKLKTRLEIIGKKAKETIQRLRKQASRSGGGEENPHSHGVSNPTTPPYLYSGVSEEEQCSIVYSTPEGVRSTKFRRSDLTRFYVHGIENLGGRVLCLVTVVADFELWLSPENIFERRYLDDVNTSVFLSFSKCKKGSKPVSGQGRRSLLSYFQQPCSCAQQPKGVSHGC